MTGEGDVACFFGDVVERAQGGFEADIAVVALGPWSMDLLAMHHKGELGRLVKG